MKIIRAQATDDLQNEIKKRFAEFNSLSKPSKGRKYPESLRSLVNRAAAQGVKLRVLKRLTGMSESALKRCEKMPPATTTARRLAVVDAEACPLPLPAPVGIVVVRLPSGVSIELCDRSALDHDFLAALASLEVRHVTTR